MKNLQLRADDICCFLWFTLSDVMAQLMLAKMSTVLFHSFDLLNINGGVSSFVAYLWKVKVGSNLQWCCGKDVNIKDWLLFFKSMLLHSSAFTSISASAHQNYRVLCQAQSHKCIIHSYKKKKKKKTFEYIPGNLILNYVFDRHVN